MLLLAFSVCEVDRTIGAEAATARRLQDMKLEVWHGGFPARIKSNQVQKRSDLDVFADVDLASLHIHGRKIPVRRNVRPTW